MPAGVLGQAGQAIDHGIEFVMLMLLPPGSIYSHGPVAALGVFTCMQTNTQKSVQNLFPYM
jgi:hypothetical protein